MPQPYPTYNLADLVNRAAQRYDPNVPGVDFGDLLRRVVMQESGGRMGSVSPTGAIGFMQLMPGTAKELGVNPYDPWQNVMGGAKYLAQGVGQYGVEGGLRRYNSGNPQGFNPETNTYVQ